MYRPALIPVVVTPPDTTPVTLAAVKNFGRISGTDDDDLITGFINAATEQAELYTGLMFINRTLKYTLQAFPYQHYGTPWWGGTLEGPISGVLGGAAPIWLPCRPLHSVISIVTYDENDVSTTVDPTTYRVVTSGGRIVLKEGESWPTGLRNEDAIEITVVAGYGADPSAVPSSVATAIMMQAQAMYDSRTVCGMCDGSKNLLNPLRAIKV